MPPPSNAQKGSKAGKLSAAPRDGRQSRSRNTTPSSIGGVGNLPTAMELDVESKYLELTMHPFPQTTYESLVDPSYLSTIPDSKAIDGIIASLNAILVIAEARGIACDAGMRELAKRRKAQIEDERLGFDEIDRDEVEGMRRQVGGASSKMKKKSGGKREEKERPLTHGAHGLAPQDGSNLVGAAPTSSPQKPPATLRGGRRPSREGSASSSLSPVDNASPGPSGAAGKKAQPAPTDLEEDESSEEEHQPPPAPAIPHLMTFGDDPWNFPDPTEYEIKPTTPEMPEREKKKIFSVADYPHNDLHDLIPGIPPDEDFANKKPMGTQVQANTFAVHVESYLRPFQEDDLAWLRERNNNPHDFLIPNRGKKHYRQIWDEEDGAVAPRRTDKSSANEARGSLEDLDENTAETDMVSIPPLSERLLSLLRPEHRPSAADAAANGAAESANADLDNMLGVEPTPVNPTTKYPPATQMPESNAEHWKKAVHPELSYPQLEERLKQEFRFAGFMPPDSDPDYDNGEDDEIAVRMRVLQARLKLVSAKNNARKSVLSEKLQDHLAYQEYTTIKEDLDSQVVSNFGKRTRSMGKKSKVKRPGGAGGGSHAAAQGMARPGIGDATKIVMEKRKKWIGEISPIFDAENFKVPRAEDPNSSIFKGPAFEAALKKEMAMQNDEIGEAEAEEE